MIIVAEALELVMKTSKDFGVESCPFDQAQGRVLREALGSDRPLPPYNRVTMDGIAIDIRAFEMGQRAFQIAGIAPAGSPQLQLQEADKCIEVMTGAILPEGTDSVIRYEDLEIAGGMATILLDQMKWGQNVHKKGEDRSVGELIVRPGCMITPAEIGVAATTGKLNLEVSKLPKCIIISTGDELVEVDQKPLDHQIRKSNIYTIQGSLKKLGIKADLLHIMDDYQQIVARLKKLIAEYEVLILSGGVSKGKFDYLPKALEELGVRKHFHKIKQRPGKPFWFGTHPGGTVVFALPGNPVSSFMCTNRYILPWLRKGLQMKADQSIFASLATDYYFKPDLTYYLQVKINYKSDGKMEAIPVTGNGSGDLANLVDADAFLELPRGRDEFKKGEIFPLIRYR